MFELLQNADMIPDMTADMLDAETRFDVPVKIAAAGSDGADSLSLFSQ